MEKKLTLPASYGGIMQYYDTVTSKIRLKPIMVLAIAIAVIIGVVFLHMANPLGL